MKKTAPPLTISGAAATAFLIAALHYLFQTVVQMHDREFEDMKQRIAALEARCKP